MRLVVKYDNRDDVIVENVKAVYVEAMLIPDVKGISYVTQVVSYKWSDAHSVVTPVYGLNDFDLPYNLCQEIKEALSSGAESLEVETWSL